VTSQLEFTVVGTPSPQGSKVARRFGDRTAVVDVNPVALRSWRQDVRQAALEAIPDGWDVDQLYTVVVGFVLARPKSLPKSHSGLHGRKPDVDKLARGVLDALTEARVFRDDSRVWALTATKRYENERLRPGCLIQVQAIPERVTA
jgi:crossover junction endodeoxyribonuclease RusA